MMAETEQKEYVVSERFVSHMLWAMASILANEKRMFNVQDVKATQDRLRDIAKRAIPYLKSVIDWDDVSASERVERIIEEIISADGPHQIDWNYRE